MNIEDLCNKQINDLYICYKYFYARNGNDYNIYYSIEYEVMKEYISEEKVVDICCGYRHRFN